MSVMGCPNCDISVDTDYHEFCPHCDCPIFPDAYPEEYKEFIERETNKSKESN